MDCKKIGLYIQNKRKKLGITQEELGERLSLSSKAVSKWECGKALPDVNIIQDLATILNVEVIELLNGEDKLILFNEEKKKKRKKYLIFGLGSLVIILLILVLFLGNYYINNKVYVYDLVSDSASFLVNGEIVKIHDDTYIFLYDMKYIGDKEDFLFISDLSYEIIYKNKVLYKKEKMSFDDSKKQKYDFNLWLENMNLFINVSDILNLEFEPYENLVLKLTFSNSNFDNKIYDINVKITK